MEYLIACIWNTNYLQVCSENVKLVMSRHVCNKALQRGNSIVQASACSLCMSANIKFIQTLAHRRCVAQHPETQASNQSL
jgi:hypothetical protein